MRTSKYATNASPVIVSDNMSGKMSGIPSISTACLCNARCLERMQKPGTICSKCFAVPTTKRYKALQENLKANTELLTARVLEDDELPRFGYNVGMLRFESFGDLNNETQATNYLNIARVNAHVKCAIWTKNPDIMAKALEHTDKPENLQIIYSSPIINSPVTIETIRKRFPFIDKVFTVYDKKTIKERNIEINCGARSCAGCARCYMASTETEIKEQLK